MKKLNLRILTIAAGVALNLAGSKNAVAWTSSQNGPNIHSLTSIKTVKVLTIALFDGEAQYWVEREKMTEQYLIPGAFSPLFCNSNDHCLIVTGPGTSNAASSIMALGLNTMLDLEKTYFLVAGIGGGNPELVTLGSVVWAKWIVDSDLAYEIDAREIPSTFEFPRFHLGCGTPWCDTGWKTGTEVFQLNASLVDQAFLKTKDTELLDGAIAKKTRIPYNSKLQKSVAFKLRGGAAKGRILASDDLVFPFVTECDSVSGQSYYHGRTFSKWAKWWLSQWTGGQGKYCITDMEDSGVLAALQRLSTASKIDLRRVLVLRGVSNFDQPSDSVQPLDSLRTKSGGYGPAVENVYRVGSQFTQEILAHWGTWRNVTNGTNVH